MTSHIWLPPSFSKIKHDNRNGKQESRKARQTEEPPAEFLGNATWAPGADTIDWQHKDRQVICSVDVIPCSTGYSIMYLGR